MADDMVPKSDLIALKESHTKTLGDLKTEHTSAITSLGEEHTSKVTGLETQIKTSSEDLQRIRATVTDLEEKGKTHETTTGELATAKKDLKSSQDALKAAQETLATDLRGTLIGQYKIAEKALEGKTVTDLTTIKDALAGSSGPKSKDYTAGGGGGGTGDKTTGKEKIAQGLEAGDLKAT